MKKAFRQPMAASGSGLAYYLTTIPTIYSTRFFEENAAWMDSREATLNMSDVFTPYGKGDGSIHKVTCPVALTMGIRMWLFRPTW